MFQEPRQRTLMETFQFKDGRSTTRKWWSLWRRRCQIRAIFYLHFKLKRSLATLRLQCLKHRNRSVKLCSIHRTNWEVTSTLTLSVQLMLWFCRMQTRLKIKKKQNTCFKTLQKGRWWEHSNLRMEGLPLTSDGAYDKHDAKFVSYFTSLSCPSLALP